ncbi:DNA primase large subunit Spp2 [Oleoguttula sp. CCFEE 5521]
MSVAGAPQKISLGLGGIRKAPAPTNGVKRSHAALQETGDDEDVQERATKVSHFDSKAGGAIDEGQKDDVKGPLIIARQANRNWKDSAKTRRGQSNGISKAQTVLERSREETVDVNPTPRIVLRAKQADSDKPTVNGMLPEAPAEAAESAPRSTVDRAMDALLGKETKSTLVVPAVTEDEAFAQDITTAPDMATLDDYARVPVEQFGAAMLRGMGWKDGEGIGLNKGKKAEKTKIPERRPVLLGIGAKEEAAVAGEMGAWGKAARGYKGKEPVIYNPILLRDKRTGELFTEEELQKRKERVEKEKLDLEFEEKEKERELATEKERRRKRDGKDSEREHHSRKDDSHDKDRHSRRERDRSRDKRRHDSSEDEDDRRRRKEKERRRRERDRYDDENRERSKRSDRDSHKRRDRSGDRRR